MQFDCLTTHQILNIHSSHRTMIAIRKRNILFIFVIAVIILGTISFSVTQQIYRIESKNLENNLSRMISLHKSRDLAFIDLSMIATFSWDRLYLFGPYMPSEVINKSLDGAWRRYWKTSIEYDEGIVLMVFTNKGKVVQYLEFPRGPDCHFTGAQNLDGFKREDAHFIVDHKERCVPLE